MSGGHGGHGVEAMAARHSPVHDLDPRVKIVTLIGLTVVSVSTPSGAWVAFGAYGLLLFAMTAAARLPAGYVVSRMSVELPFLVAAAILPFTAETTGQGVTEGLTLAAKITVGVVAMVVLSSTTPFPRLLRGFEALHAPRTLTVIVAFMWRYLHVIGDEVHRARVAREARGYAPRWLWHAKAVASSVATLFVRSLERGERVYLAMVSRGYSGGIPAAVGTTLTLRQADVAFALAFAATLAAARGLLA